MKLLGPSTGAPNARLTEAPQAATSGEILIDTGQTASARVQVDERKFGIDFSQSGDSAAWRTYGWGVQETDCVWTSGRQSELRLPPMFGNEVLFLDLDVMPWIDPPLISKQILRLWVCGHLLGIYTLASRCILRFTIPTTMRSDRSISLQFEQPCFVTPNLLGQSMDSVPRGIAVFSVRVSNRSQEAESIETPAVGSPSPTLVTPSLTDAREGQRESFTLQFDPAGMDKETLIDGWYTASDGHIWTGARVSSLSLPLPSGPGHYQLSIGVTPLRLRPIVAAQRITIILNGFVVAQFRLGSDTCIVILIPPETIAGSAPRFELTFITPDAIALSDFATPSAGERLAFIFDTLTIEPNKGPTRLIYSIRDDELGATRAISETTEFCDQTLETLPAAVEAKFGDNFIRVLQLFESIGDNCGFGIAQRKAGAEVLGLLRFGNTPLRALLHGLDDEFAAAADSSEISVDFGDGVPREFLVKVNRYGIRWHTGRFEGSSTATEIFNDNAIKLPYLRRKFNDGLVASRKIYVMARGTPAARSVHLVPTPGGHYFRFHPSEALRLTEVVPVWQALQQLGPNTLLYVVPCNGDKPPGMVELLAPGLMRAHIATLAISDDVEILDHLGWLQVVANAWALYKLRLA